MRVAAKTRAPAANVRPRVISGFDGGGIGASLGKAIDNIETKSAESADETPRPARFLLPCPDCRGPDPGGPGRAAASEQPGRRLRAPGGTGQAADLVALDQ